MRTIRFLLHRPGDPRYPDGYKVVELPINEQIELVSSGEATQHYEPLLCELSSEERAKREEELQKRLNQKSERE